MAMLVKWVTKWSNCQLPSPKDAVANDYTNPTVDKNKNKRQKRNDDTLGIVATNPTRDLLHVERSLPKDSVAISATFFGMVPFSTTTTGKKRRREGAAAATVVLVLEQFSGPPTKEDPIPLSYAIESPAPRKYQK